LEYGRVNCRFDELRYDLLHNQIIKATLRRLADVNELDATLRHNLRQLTRVLIEVSDVRLSNAIFRRVQLSRNNGHYDLLIKICELVQSALLPEENGQGGRFLNILQDEVRMSAVFEAFVRNFLKTEQVEYSVGAEYIQWDGQAHDIESSKCLPAMLTDVTLRSKHRNIIIDAKFYPETLQKYHGQQKIRSDHLYQLFSYLKNFKSQSTTKLPVEGILLYPTTSQSLDLSYTLGGHAVRIKTIRLDQPWKNIHLDMCALLNRIPKIFDYENAPIQFHAPSLSAQ
jgi:5-methylcytosine-specific restriction enzyme subunit McrC